MKFSSAVISSLAVIALSSVIVHAQVLSMSRFSSSGLVFPGPPGQGARPQQRSESPNGEQMTRRSAQSPQPVRVRPQKLPAVPLSMIGKQPEEFIAAAQQRQQQQQQQQQQQEQQQRAQAQQAAQIAPKQDAEEEEEEFASSEAQEEFLPKPAPVRPLQRQDIQRPVARPQPQREEPERPVRPQQREEPTRPRPRPAQPQQQEFQRPEPSIQQPVQQRRPNYPPNYKPRPQEVNAVEEERRRPPQPEEEIEPEVPEEEEEVKPDKLQLLLQKTQFGCVEKKDGYYADEELDCEVFHYCQDRVRHSWLCPEGASFHQVHLICMPISKENICKKSSQFHFVNDYLYKPLQDEDGNNSTLYADRYYPEGYEPGFDMGEIEAPEKPKLQTYVRRPQNSAEVGNGRRRQPAQRQGSENPRKNVDVRRPPFSVPNDEEEDSFFNNPPPFRNENRRISYRRPAPSEDDFSGEEEEE